MLKGPLWLALTMFNSIGDTPTPRTLNNNKQHIEGVFLA